MGSFWVRTVLSVFAVVDESLDIAYSPPPESVKLHRQLVSEFLVEPLNTKIGKNLSDTRKQRHLELCQPSEVCPQTHQV